MPDKIGKYRDKAVIEPARVIKERKQIGLHPSCPVPVGAIMCYDAAFWQWVREYPGNAECDGWLKGSYLVPYEDSRILVIKVPGFGAPTAVMTLEELIAFGIKKFVNLGAAGGLQQNMNIGDIVICDRAIRDEGTSFHYLPGEKFAYASPELTERLNTAFERKGIECSRGTSWTTDAPYRETNEELRQYRSEGVATVEMETSALLAVGAYWNQGYHSEEKLESLKRIFEVAIEILSKGDIRDAHYDDNREEVHPKSDLRNPFGVGGVS
jgi:hypothetical protein